MPLDPVYAWSIVLEPVETLIECTAGFIKQLARETYERGEEFDDQELLTRLPDADPAMGRRILGPRRWLHAQRIRINRLVAYWHEHGDPSA